MKLDRFIEIVNLLEKNNIPYTMFYDPEGYESVDKASEKTGYPPDKILKTMILEVDGELMVYILKGNEKIDIEKMKKALGARNIRLASPSRIYEETRLKIGGISMLHPNIHKLRTYISATCLTLNDVVVGGGDKYHLFKVGINDILKIAKPETI